MSATPLVALMLLLVALWFCRLEPPPTPPMPGLRSHATALYLSYRVLQRAAAGLSLLLLGPLIARAALGLYSERQVLRAGVLASVPLSAALILSVAIYFPSEPTSRWGPFTPRLHELPFNPSMLLVVGASLSVAIALFFVTRIFSRPPSGSA